MFEKRKQRKLDKHAQKRFEEARESERLELILKKESQKPDWAVDINMDNDPDAIERRERIEQLKSRLGKS